MKDIVIIKLFKPDYSSCDFHDLYLEGHLVVDANAEISELKAFGEKINKNILFTVCPSLTVADFDSFAEISYSGTLSDEEKKM
ncbi:MAG: hypothetical protein LUF82_07885 [Clostridia bacterium]|nr:hypothetical protein [Clostridia bacterium]